MILFIVGGGTNLGGGLLLAALAKPAAEDAGGERHQAAHQQVPDILEPGISAAIAVLIALLLSGTFTVVRPADFKSTPVSCR